MRIKEYLKPGTLSEAVDILNLYNGTVIGGGAFLHLQKGEIEAAVDLSKLGLDFIDEKDGNIEIGAQTTLRSIEKNGLFKSTFGGIISDTASSIMGVQIRNIATIGGTVSGRYGFSDLLTCLLVLDTYVELYKGGLMPLQEFMMSKTAGDILIKIIIKKDNRKASCSCLKNTSTDFSILNTAVSKEGGTFSISVGARPGAAALAYKAMEYMDSAPVCEESAQRAGEIAGECLSFGDDIRASAAYRKELCKVLVKRCILEVIK